MKFLCVSDQVDPLVYSPTAKERYEDIDAVICAGDLSMEYVDYIVTTLGKPTFFVFGNHDLKEFPLYKKGARSLTAMNDVQLMNKGHGADYVSNKVLRIKNLMLPKEDGTLTPLLITGVSGSIKYNAGEAQYTNTQMFIQLLHLVPSLLWNKIRYGRYCDIFLTHASPRHIHDKEDNCHKGFECFNWFIKKFSPAMLLHGHIHLYDLHDIRRTDCNNTAVINVFSHLVVEYTPEFPSKKGVPFVPHVSILSDR